MTYDDAIELAARLYCGYRIAEMALAGDMGMTRVTGADAESMAAMIVEIKALNRAMQAKTRLGREAWTACGREADR